jgi:hypothetical protein
MVHFVLLFFHVHDVQSLSFASFSPMHIVLSLLLEEEKKATRGGEEGDEAAFHFVV